jgi:hypothetical protein
MLFAINYARYFVSNAFRPDSTLQGRTQETDVETRHGLVTSRAGAISTVRVEVLFVATVVDGGA